MICSMLDGTADHIKLLRAAFLVLRIYKPEYNFYQYENSPFLSKAITYEILHCMNISGMTPMEEVLEVYINDIPVERISKKYMDAFLRRKDVHSVLLNSPHPPTKAECKFVASISMSRHKLKTKKNYERLDYRLLNSLCCTPPKK